MNFLNKKIASRQARRWFIVLSLSLLVLFGFEVLSLLADIYQVHIFIQVAVVIYAYLLVKMSFVFDLNLKKYGAWKHSLQYYRHHKGEILKWFKIVFRAIGNRFHYLRHWENWRHFQNYLILPGVLYWAVVMLIFLNPFDMFLKQLFVITGTVLMTIAIWHLKMIFIDYSRASIQVRYLMFTTTIFTAFLIYSAALGMTWYLGLSKGLFVLAVGALTFLLFYQSLFHRGLVQQLKNLGWVLLGAGILSATAAVVIENWTVNFYSGGLLMAAVAYLFWGLSLQHIQKRLTARLALDYILIFLLVLIFVLSTTNFSARIS